MTTAPCTLREQPTDTGHEPGGGIAEHKASVVEGKRAPRGRVGAGVAAVVGGHAGVERSGSKECHHIGRRSRGAAREVVRWPSSSQASARLLTHRLHRLDRRGSNTHAHTEKGSEPKVETFRVGEGVEDLAGAHNRVATVGHGPAVALPDVTARDHVVGHGAGRGVEADCIRAAWIILIFGRLIDGK